MACNGHHFTLAIFFVGLSCTEALDDPHPCAAPGGPAAFFEIQDLSQLPDTISEDDATLCIQRVPSDPLVVSNLREAAGNLHVFVDVSRNELDASASEVSLEFPRLERVGGVLYLELAGSAVRRVELPELRSADRIAVFLNASLETSVRVRLPVLDQVREVKMSAFDSAVTVEVDSLASAETVEGHPLLAPGLRSAQVVQSISFPGTSSISSDLSVLEAVGRLEYIGASTSTLTIPSLRRADALHFSDWSNIAATLALPVLEEVTQDLELQSLGRLQTIDAPLVQSVGGQFIAKDLPEMPRCRLEALAASWGVAPQNVTIENVDDSSTCP